MQICWMIEIDVKYQQILEKIDSERIPTHRKAYEVFFYKANVNAVDGIMS